MRRDLVFWFPRITPYMADRFEALHRAKAVDFECWFTQKIDPDRSWIVDTQSLEFPHRFVQSVSIGPVTTGTPLAQWATSRPRVLISFHAAPLVAGSVLQNLLPDSQLVYYVIKTFDSWTKRSWPKEFAKRRLFQLADGFMTPGDDSDDYVRRYSKPLAPVMRLNQVIDVPHFASARVLRHTSESRERRAKLGLSGFVFLYVGRIWSQKGIGTLIEAFDRVQKSGVDSSLLIVGDGVDQQQYRELVRHLGLRNVVFLDFVQQAALPEIYALSDAFVFPTRGDPYGLVVDEAMASGIPVISTTSAGEISERIVPGESGYLVPRDDADSMARSMSLLSERPNLSAQMGDRAHDMVKHRTPEHWTRQIESNLEYLLMGKRR